MYLPFPVQCNIVKPRGSTSERWRMTRPIAFSQAAMRPLRITGKSLQWQDVHEPNEPVTGCIGCIGPRNSSRLLRGQVGKIDFKVERSAQTKFFLF